MAIKILGGLTIENFADQSSDNIRRVGIQKKLYEEGVINGIQLRVGHKLTNQAPIEQLIPKLNQLKIPFIIHGGYESLGIDFGESCDLSGKFAQFSELNSDVSWEQFNTQALQTAQYVAQAAEHIIDSQLIVVHPGYALPDQIEQSKGRLSSALNRSLKDIPLCLEPTFPLVFDPEDPDKLLWNGLGSLPSDLRDVLDRCQHSQPRQVLLDFTHIQVAANQLAQYPDRFPTEPNYSQLIESYLDFPELCPAFHYSGYTDKVWDEHAGFTHSNPIPDEHTHAVNRAIEQMSSRFSTVYATVELFFDDYDTSFQQINAFRQQFLNR